MISTTFNKKEKTVFDQLQKKENMSHGTFGIFPKQIRVIKFFFKKGVTNIFKKPSKLITSYDIQITIITRIYLLAIDTNTQTLSNSRIYIYNQ